MKKRFTTFFNPRTKFVIALVCALPFCVNAQSKTNQPATATTTTSAPVVPQARFIKPKDRTEGRDPFYPRSSYPYIGDAPVIVQTNTVVQPTVVAVELKLNGISGLPPHRLAMINNRT